MFLVVTSNTAIAQLTITISNSSLKTVIQQIQAQSSYQFFYNDDLADVQVKSLNVKDASLESVLNKALSDKKITYKIEDNVVYLSRVGDTSKVTQANQQHKVTGKVIDTNNESLIGVSVLEKGTNNGTITNLDGNYTLELSNANAILQFSYVGYQPIEISVKGQSIVNVKMQEDTQVLNEVVVTALGIKREKKALSYNVQEIKQDEITRIKDANFINSLNGKVAGVTINSSSSGIGGVSKVIMRGTKSIDKSNNALYVIDGIPMISISYTQGEGRFDSSGSTEGIADINPEDIESMTVLTGASAAALYGSAAANGAILITTKRGDAKKIKISISSNSELGRPFVMPKFQNTYGNDGRIESWGAKLPDSAEKYNPKDFFQRTHLFTNSVTLSGGSDKNQTFLSASSTNSRGLVPNNKYNRYNFTFTNTSYFLNDNLKIDASVNYIIQNNRNMVNQGEYMNPLVSAYLLPRGDGLEKTRAFEKYNSTRKIYEQVWGDFSGQDGLFGGTYSGDYSMQNPYWIAYRNLRDMKRERYMLSLTVSYDIKKWNDSEIWNILSRIRTDNTRYKSTDKRYASTLSTLDVSKNGYFGFNEGVEKQTYIDILTSINKNLKWDEVGNFQLNINLGASLQDSRVDGSFNKGPIRENGIPNFFNLYQVDQEHKKTISGQEGWIEQTQSIFGNIEIGYNNYLYLTITGRNDWASQLANSPQKSFFYPSVGVSAIITDMLSEDTKNKLWKSLSFLKIKFAHSSVASPFPRELTSPTFKFDDDNKVWQGVSHYPIGKLYPERTKSFETGLSSRWLKNKLSFDLTFYRTNTYNQTIKTDISASSGYDAYYVQTGKVKNWGIESSLGYTAKFNKFSWNTFLSLGYNKNKISSLMEDYLNPITGKKESKKTLTKQSFGALRYILKTGGSIGDIYSAADFKRNIDGAIFVDENGNVSSEYYSEDKYKKNRKYTS